MDNFSNTPGRRQVQDISAVNSFLTKMYSLMILAVLVSAATAFLTMTVFASAIANMSQAVYWIIVFVPIVLCMTISFKAAKNPTLGIVLLLILSAAPWLRICLYRRSIYFRFNRWCLFISSWRVRSNGRLRFCN